MQISKDSAPELSNFAVIEDEEVHKSPSSPEAFYCSSCTGGVSPVGDIRVHEQSQVDLCSLKTRMDGLGAAQPLQVMAHEDDELREKNKQLEEQVSLLEKKLKESTNDVRMMVSKCERYQRQIAGENTDNSDEESLEDQVDELRVEVWERDDKIKELEKELSHAVEHSAMIHNHHIKQNTALKDQINELQVNIGTYFYVCNEPQNLLYKAKFLWGITHVESGTVVSFGEEESTTALGHISSYKYMDCIVLIMQWLHTCSLYQN